MTKQAMAPGDIVARQIRRFREAKGWSVKRLAEECKSLGLTDLTQSSLANIERGSRPAARTSAKEAPRAKRGVTVDEWIALAFVLGVSPLTLLLPIVESDDYGYVASTDDIAVTNDVNVMWGQFAEWLTGRAAVVGLAHRTRALLEGGVALGLVRAVGDLDRAAVEEIRHNAAVAAMESDPDGTDDLIAAARRRHARSAVEVIDRLRELLDRDIVPADIDPNGSIARSATRYTEDGTPLPARVADLFARHGLSPGPTDKVRGSRHGRR